MMSDVPAEVVNIIQAIIIFFVTAEAFLSKYQHKLVVKEVTTNG